MDHLKNILCLCFFQVILFSAHAQPKSIVALRANPAISWIASTSFEYSFEGRYSSDHGAKELRTGDAKRTTDVEMYKINAELMKYTVSTKKCLMKYMIQSMMNGSISVAALVGGKVQKIDKEEVKNTLILFDLLKSTDEFNEALLPDKMLVNQIWYYDKQKERIQNYVNGFTPVFETINAEGLVESTALFFIQYSSIKNAPVFNLNNDRFIWAKSTKGLFEDLKNWKVLKGNTSQMIKEVFWDIDKKKPMPEVYSRTVISGVPQRSTPEVMDFKQLMGFKEPRVDTVITFDPVTYEEEINVVKSPALQVSDINRARIVQLWYYDDKTHQLQSEIKSVGPAIKISSWVDFLYYYNY